MGVLPLFGLAGLVIVGASAEGPAQESASSNTEATGTEATGTPPAPSEPTVTGEATAAGEGGAPAVESAEPPPAVSDEAWNALVDKHVAISTTSGEATGTLLSVGTYAVVLAETSGVVKTIQKADATGVKLVDPPAQPTPEPQPQPEPYSPPPQGEPYSPPPTETYDPPEPEPPPKKEFVKLGLFTSHGGGYAHWGGPDAKEGTGAYVWDVGLGINFSRGFGLYAMGGGFVGGKVFDGEVKANYFHLAPMLGFRGKYFGGFFGVGGAFSRLVGSSSTFEDAGLAVPVKLMAMIPLPKNLYVGIGIAYDFAAVRSFDIFFNGIGGQLTLGRW